MGLFDVVIPRNDIQIWCKQLTRSLGLGYLHYKWAAYLYSSPQIMSLSTRFIIYVWNGGILNLIFTKDCIWKQGEGFSNYFWPKGETTFNCNVLWIIQWLFVARWQTPFKLCQNPTFNVKLLSKNKILSIISFIQKKNKSWSKKMYIYHFRCSGNILDSHSSISTCNLNNIVFMIWIYDYSGDCKSEASN